MIRTAPAWLRQDRAWVDEVLFVGTPPVITTHPTNQTVDAGSTATFTVAGSGSSPMWFQWYFNGVKISNGSGVTGATNTTLTLANLQTAQSGNYMLIASNSAGVAMSSNAFLSVTPLFSLAEALDTVGSPLVWVTSRSSSSISNWVGQPTVTHDGEDAARSGSVSSSSSGSCSMQISVTGPGTVTFWWKVSSYTNNNRLRFYTGSSGSTERTNISGEVDWRQQTFSIASGSQILKWTYQRATSTSRGQEKGWVDEVVFLSSAPEVTSDPIVVNISRADDKILLRWAAIAGKNYQVLYKDDLSEDDWKILPGEVSISSSIATFEDDPDGQARRFYQILEH